MKQFWKRSLAAVAAALGSGNLWHGLCRHKPLSHWKVR